MSADDDLSSLKPEVWKVDEETWDWLQRELERPPETNERLVRIIRRARTREHVAKADMGPCSYCGSMYAQRDAGRHFIPCCYCNDLGHAGCQH